MRGLGLSANGVVEFRPVTDAPIGPAHPPLEHQNVSLFARLQTWLPEGKALPEATWNFRHRVVLWFVFGHAVWLPLLGILRNWNPLVAVGEGAMLGLLGLVASQKRLSRGFRSGTAALGAVTSSAILTQFSGGYIEAHFHYFVVVALIALYQDWVPFLLAIGYVALDHGVIGTLAPSWVYNHPDAIAHPWKWAVIHAVLVLSECAILIVLWKANEQSRAQADLVLSSAGEGILGLDMEGRVTFANPAAATMLGQPLAVMRGRPVGDALGRLVTHQAGTGTDLLKLFQEGHIRVGAGQSTLQNETSQTPVEWSVNPVREHGTVVGSVLTLVDATDRKRAEKEHETRIQQLSELERLKELDQFRTLFINTAAHELHTPLTPLRLQVYALKEGHKGALNPEQQSTVEVLDRNVERLSHLVEDVLNVARLQANRMVLTKKPMDLAEAVHDVVDSFQDMARESGVNLDAKLASGLMVPADEKRLAQVMYNLLDNALKFTPRGGRVQIETRRQGDGAIMEVTDNGVGIPAEQQLKLFQPFSQAHSPMERTRAGSGLGLYICRGIVELHGGRITCESAGVGLGTTFRVLLPMGEPA